MSIAIATMTDRRMGEPARIEAALSLLKDHPVYVADRGSSPGFVDMLRSMGYHVAQVEGGLTAQHKAALELASEGHSTVLYTEPDKLEWFEEGLEGTIEKYLVGERGLAAVSRSPEVFLTFPRAQQEWELRMNQIITQEIGVPGDFLYGPKFYPSALIPQVDEIRSDLGWGTLTFLIGRAARERIPISTILTASPCPPSQRSEDNDEYRAQQFWDNYFGFYAGLKAPK